MGSWAVFASGLIASGLWANCPLSSGNDAAKIKGAMLDFLLFLVFFLALLYWYAKYLDSKKN